MHRPERCVIRGVTIALLGALAACTQYPRSYSSAVAYENCGTPEQFKPCPPTQRVTARRQSVAPPPLQSYAPIPGAPSY